MSTITLNFRDEHLQEIKELAQSVGLTPEEWLQYWIEAMLIQPRDDFEQIAKYVLDKNWELHRRLAS